MSIHPYSQLISVLNGFADLSPDECEKVHKLFYPMSMKKGNFFVRCDEVSDKIGFILSGLFRYYYIDYKGIEYTKAFAAESNFVVSYSSMLRNTPSRFSIEALEDASLLCIQYTDWLDLLESNVCWQIIARKVMENVYVMKETRESELLLYDAQSRYDNFLKTFPHLKGRLKQYHIASFLGISPVSLSRIRKKLQ